METKSRESLFSNHHATTWISPPTNSSSSKDIAKFHNSLPNFASTKLISLNEVAHDLGIAHVFLKDETSRLGLPSFKILGASWAVYRALVSKYQLPQDSNIEELKNMAQKHAAKLYAATDGNHGRAVARMASLLGIDAEIHVPKDLDKYTRDLISSEGAVVVVGHGDYDETVLQASEAAEMNPEGLLVQDTAWDGYEEIPRWIVDGYSTMLLEIEDQLDGKHADLMVVPVGVGSFAQAVVTHCKSPGRTTAVLAVEPDTAACLRQSLEAGHRSNIRTGTTIMSGMNCGTVSTIAWPILQGGVDFSVTVSDVDAHHAVKYLEKIGVPVGPCGAAPLAALLRGIQQDRKALRLDASSTVVFLCTEGPREYDPPPEVFTNDDVRRNQ